MMPIRPRHDLLFDMHFEDDYERGVSAPEVEEGG